MNNANGSEITQNGLRFLQKEYDEQGLTHPDDEDDEEAGEFTATKIGKKKKGKKKKEEEEEEEKEKQQEKKQKEKETKEEYAPEVTQGTVHGGSLDEPAGDANLTPEQQQEKDLYVPPGIS
jgi:hypothetical protein